MIDPSIFEAFHLAMRPFTDELGEGWKAVRAMCILFAVITLTVWFIAYFTPEPKFTRAKEILNVSGWVTLLMFIFTYIACSVEAYVRQKERKADKLKKIKEFQ